MKLRDLYNTELAPLVGGGSLSIPTYSESLLFKGKPRPTSLISATMKVTDKGVFIVECFGYCESLYTEDGVKAKAKFDSITKNGTNEIL